MPELFNQNGYNLRKYFNLIIILLLLIIFFINFDDYRIKAKDTKRRADVAVLINALDLYHDKHGFYPLAEADDKGWDVSYEMNGGEKNFLKILKDEGLINREIFDPVNNKEYFYRYQKYPASTYGCKKAFYILQVASFELPADGNGQGKCNNFNWVKEAPYGYTVQSFD